MTPHSTLPRTAALKLRFLVVGGGIGGLAAAFALARAGHYVHVVEQAPGPDQMAAGIRIPPNLARILTRWGLGPQLAAAATKARRLAFRSLRTGEYVGSLEYKEEVMKVLEADFWLMHHTDLVRILYAAATDAGAVVQFATAVTAIDACVPSAVLSSGEIVTADILVGADGARSLVRAAIDAAAAAAADPAVPPPVGVPSGTVVYTLAVDTKDLPGDDEGWGMICRPEWSAHMGPNVSVLAHPMRGCTEFNIQIFVPDRPGSQETWDRTVPVEEIDLSWCSDGLRRLVRRASRAIETKYVVREGIEDWVHPSARAVILGEAAHPQIPSSTHSGSLAVEDAAVLGDLFSRLRTPEQARTFLYGYQELRQERCWAVQRSEAANSASVMLPDGPAQRARDAGMRAASAHGHGGWDEAQFRHLWEAIRVLFAYDPEEEVEEWWQQWGLLRERADSMSAAARAVADADAGGDAYAPPLSALHVTVDTQSTRVH